MSKELEQKQIEEMAGFIYGLPMCTKDDCDFVAKLLIGEGYHKQSENTIELPCKVGDTVYRLKKRRGIWCILPREVVSITYRLDCKGRVVWEVFSTETDVLGKSVFLTEEEAKQALAKMKGGAE